jgi:hypothetical protein
MGFNEKDIDMGLLEKWCMQDYKLKQIKNGFLIRSVPLLFKEDDDIDFSSISIGTKTKSEWRNQSGGRH